MRGQSFGKLILMAVFAAAVVAAYFAYKGKFYPTGRQYYEVCWAKKNAKDTAHAADPYQDIIWSNCENITARAVFAAGMVGEIEDDASDATLALNAACPPNPLFVTDWVNRVLEGIQRKGRSSVLDALTPAEWMIGRVVPTLWPKCDEERRKQGYPKMAEIKPGEFGWAETCIPCEARKRLKK